MNELAQDVLAAIRRLEFQGPCESNDLGPSVEVGVSGRSASAGGPLLSAPLRDLGLLLDDALIDDLLLADGPRVSIPVEMALGALGDIHEDDIADDGARVVRPGRWSGFSSSALERTVPALNEDALISPMDTLGARFRLTSWSGRPISDPLDIATSSSVAAPPLFLRESPLASRQSRKRTGFHWELLAANAAPTRDPETDGEAPLAVDAREAMGAPSQSPAPATGVRWPDAGLGAGLHVLDAGVAHEGPSESEFKAHESAGAIARAKRAPSPFAVALASAVFPGWGQALNDERGKAAVYRFASLATLFVAAVLAWRSPLGRLTLSLMQTDFGPFFGWFGTAFSAGAGLWFLSVYDAFVVRNAHRR